MGSPLRLQVTGDGDPRQTARLWTEVRAEFSAAEGDLSCYTPDSALSRLNATAGTGTWWLASSRLYRFLALADRATRVTRGRFDPRVLDDLVRLGHPGLWSAVPYFREERPTATGRQDRASWLRREARTKRVQIDAPIDSGGLGKGLTLRWAARRISPGLAGRGALLEAGGDIVGWGTSPDGQPWRVGLEDPMGGDQPLAVVTLTDGAICTSSTALRRWTSPEGRQVHHLLDPLTGEPGGGTLRAVTVAGPDSAWAEVWTKSLFLAGSERIGDEARRLGLAAWWVEAEGTVRMTPAARQRTMWLAQERPA
jgi:FAD:protein FMN transferase